ncbi:hypothetical protein FNJ47_48000, partial [Bradyrhizobium sp. UFLA 03-164]|nr:hypothetical protein [Bradyrhizobium uaiense]
LLSKSPLGAEASSMWAQGGLAAPVGADDTPALHLADTLAAGAVAGGVHDAVAAMCGLEPEAPAAVGAPVEGDAELGEMLHGR